MYYYTEYLRAKRGLFVVAIILGAMLLSAVVLRLSLKGTTADKWMGAVETSPTAHVTQTRLPDGTQRVVVDDPVKKVHAVIDHRGNVYHMDLTEPQNAIILSSDISMGNLNVQRNAKNGTDHVVADYHQFEIPLGVYILSTLPIGLVLASLLAGPLSKENHNHLELAWTKPVSRESYALAAIGVDLVAIVIAEALTLVVYILGTFLFATPPFKIEPNLGLYVCTAVLGAFAWYAALTAFSASLKRGLGMVVGLGWLFAFLIPAIAAGTSEAASAVGRAVHTLTHALAYLDPLAYLNYSSKVHSNNLTFGIFGASQGTASLALLALTIVYIAVAVLQWRRVEA